MMPGENGWTFLESLRKSGDRTPAIFLTARDSVPERIKGLELGADDYLIKPFDFQELLARISAVMRRHADTRQLVVGDLDLDLDPRHVTLAGRRIDLSPRSGPRTHIAVPSASANAASGPMTVALMQPSAGRPVRGSRMWWLRLPSSSKSFALLLTDLGVAQSLNRPYVSNDNPFSEALFKTAKYSPEYPGRFGGLEHARAWAAPFFQYCNHEHHHSGLGMMTPADVHLGRVEQVRQVRQEALDAAYARHPERFVRKPPVAPRPPSAVWINPPKPAGSAH